jgi:hypothetical protein
MSNNRTTKVRAAVEQLLGDVAGTDSFIGPRELVAAGVPRDIAVNLSRATKGLAKSDVAELLDDVTDDLSTAFADDNQRDPAELAKSVGRDGMASVQRSRRINRSGI